MLVQIKDWRKYLDDGGKFLNTAVNGSRKRPEVFTPEIIYNLTAMAIEKFCMGYLMYHGDLADNHTMGDLIEAVERHTGPQPELSKKFLFLDSFQEICSLDAYKRRSPTASEMGAILIIGLEVKKFVAAEIQRYDHDRMRRKGN
ncbi:MAG: hypothetical protein GXP59_08255 [Deltaproteobacteria bacterium]|nr:hypothetical protein [Deltaproteobacteria bacterium]